MSPEVEKYIAGVDIGNATTEVALGKIQYGKIISCISSLAKTSGIKGTKDNTRGVIQALSDACNEMGIQPAEISEICINEATPVIGDFAMETVTETIITESTMIGHNPDTPGGEGFGIGISIPVENLNEADINEEYIVIIGEKHDFDEIAITINHYFENGLKINGLIMQKDDGVLVNNRLNKVIPILDEVKMIDSIPLGLICAVEVAAPGRTIDYLTNPYGIATAFNLNSDETKQVAYIAKALIGNRSAVVIKTPHGEIKERSIPAGELILQGKNNTYKVDIEDGSEKIMATIKRAYPIQDVRGSVGTNVGGMIESVRKKMAVITNQKESDVYIKDIMAVDTLVPQKISGALANEFSMEKSVGLAAMVRTNKLSMQQLADLLSDELKCPVSIGGVEGDMALTGALTTPGTSIPILIVDIGAGSTDACYLNEKDEQSVVHLAGAGNMVTALIAAELGLVNTDEAEAIKKYPLAKVESLFHVRYEDGSIEFFDEPLDNDIYAKIVTVQEDGFMPVNTRHNMEKVRFVRRDVKQRVLVSNVLRAMQIVSPTNEIRAFSHVVLLGGSNLDFELSNMLTDVLAYQGITSGKGNIRGVEGPRNAVATGLLYSRLKEMFDV